MPLPKFRELNLADYNIYYIIEGGRIYPVPKPYSNGFELKQKIYDVQGPGIYRCYFYDKKTNEKKGLKMVTVTEKMHGKKLAKRKKEINDLSTNFNEEITKEENQDMDLNQLIPMYKNLLEDYKMLSVDMEKLKIQMEGLKQNQDSFQQRILSELENFRNEFPEDEYFDEMPQQVEDKDSMSQILDIITKVAPLIKGTESVTPAQITEYVKAHPEIIGRVKEQMGIDNAVQPSNGT
jgi:hypothetical protein